MNIIWVGLYWFEKVAIYHLPGLKPSVWSVLLMAAAIAFGIWMDLSGWKWIILQGCVAVYLGLSFYVWALRVGD